MTNHPEITVLTIVCNGERYIREAVNSILNQTYENFEYILVNNNSTDNTPGILEDYAQKDKRIKIIKETRQGVLYARNAGLQIAKGDWVAILDADDIALPQRLECQLNFIEQNPSAVLVGSGCIMIDEDGKYIKEYRYPADHTSLVRYLEERGVFFAHSSAFYNRQAVAKLGGYRFTAAEDYDLWLRLSIVGEIACIQEFLTKLRRHIQSNSYNTDQEYYLLYKVIPLICHFRKKMGLSDLFLKREKWNGFLEWTRMQMENSDCFKKGEAQREFFRTWYSRDNNKLIRTFQLIHQITSNRFVAQSLLNRSYLLKAATQIAQKSAEVFGD
jgi:glycosyltransferase involved in cell wall biosynthesis